MKTRAAIVKVVLLLAKLAVLFPLAWKFILWFVFFYPAQFAAAAAVYVAALGGAAYAAPGLRRRLTWFRAALGFLAVAALFDVALREDIQRRQCAELAPDERVVPIVSRCETREGAARDACEAALGAPPYDAYWDPDKDEVYVSHCKGGGWLAALSIDGAASRLVATDGCTQRFVRRPGTREFIFAPYGAKSIRVATMDAGERVADLWCCDQRWYKSTPVEIVLDAESFYALGEFGDVTAYRTDSLRLLGAKPPEPFPCVFYSMDADPGAGKLYANAAFPPALFKIDAAGLKTDLRRRLWFPTLKVLFDAPRNRVYVASPLQSAVRVFDPATLEERAPIPAPYGVRDLDLDEARGVLYEAGYFDGTLRAVDLSTGGTLWEEKLGRKLRGIYYDDARRRLFAVSLCGVFEVKDP